MGKVRTTDRLSELDSTDIIGSNKENTTMTGVEKKSELEMQEIDGERSDIVWLRERGRATGKGETVFSDNDITRSKVSHTKICKWKRQGVRTRTATMGVQSTKRTQEKEPTR